MTYLETQVGPQNLTIGGARAPGAPLDLLVHAQSWVHCVCVCVTDLLSDMLAVGFIVCVHVLLTSFLTCLLSGLLCVCVCY